MTAKIIVIISSLVLLSGCYPIDTDATFSDDYNFAEYKSEPVYLSFRENKDASYYFLLGKDSDSNNFRITVRWKNKQRGTLLFDGQRTTLKFMVDRKKIYQYHPIMKTRVVTYNLNINGHEEEAVFEMPEEVFREIAYARYVTVELKGRSKTVIGEFNRLNTKKAFRNFYENSI